MFQIGREVLDIAGRAIAPGVTTAEIDQIVYDVSNCVGTLALEGHSQGDRDIHVVDNI